MRVIKGDTRSLDYSSFFFGGWGIQNPRTIKGTTRLWLRCFAVCCFRVCVVLLVVVVWNPTGRLVASYIILVSVSFSILFSLR